MSDVQAATEERPVSRYVDVKDGVVVNIVKADADTAKERGWLPAPDDVAIDDTFDGKEFSKPVIVADPKEVRMDAADAIQQLLDSTAQAHGYDTMLSLCSYATSSNPKWQAEGAAGAVWRDAVWGAAETIQNEVLAGKRELPTVDEVLAAMPAISWPAKK